MTRLTIIHLFSELPKNYQEFIVYEKVDIFDLPFKDLFSPNDELIVELVTEEIFHGEFVEAGQNRIDLRNIVRIDIGNKISTTLSFYRNELVRIRHLKHVIEEKKESFSPSKSDRIKLDREEYYRLKEMVKCYIFIDDLCLSNPVYCDAIKTLCSAETIGVAAPGILRREPSIPLIALATWKQIFIFDTSKLEQKYFAPQMKEILEREDICKVIHKGAPLLGILRRYFDVCPQNVFDTEVVDLMIQKNENPNKEIKYARNIFECLETYLNFPKRLNESFKVKPEKWAKRPVKDSKKIHISQLVVYLITLKLTLNDILFTGLHNTVDNFYNYYSNLFKNPYDFAKQFKLEEVSSDMDDFIDSTSSLSLS